MKSSDKVYPDSFPIASSDPASLSVPHLLQLLDRPIAFHRCFVTLTGSVTAALMLSQALYWQRRCKDPEGWWYKSRDDWAEETGLSRYEQEGARKQLRKLGVVQEHLRGVPATIWYRVNKERLFEGLSKIARQRTSTLVPVGGKPAIQLVENQPTGWRNLRQLLRKLRLLLRLLLRLPPPQTPPPRTRARRSPKSRVVVVVLKTKTKTRPATTGPQRWSRTRNPRSAGKRLKPHRPRRRAAAFHRKPKTRSPARR